jgi:hypothetical protein
VGAGKQLSQAASQSLWRLDEQVVNSANCLNLVWLTAEKSSPECALTQSVEERPFRAALKAEQISGFSPGVYEHKLTGGKRVEQAFRPAVKLAEKAGFSR